MTTLDARLVADYDVTAPAVERPLDAIFVVAARQGVDPRAVVSALFRRGPRYYARKGSDRLYLRFEKV